MKPARIRVVWRGRVDACFSAPEHGRVVGGAQHGQTASLGVSRRDLVIGADGPQRKKAREKHSVVLAEIGRCRRTIDLLWRRVPITKDYSDIHGSVRKWRPKRAAIEFADLPTGQLQVGFVSPRAGYAENSLARTKAGWMS